MKAICVACVVLMTLFLTGCKVREDVPPGFYELIGKSVEEARLATDGSLEDLDPANGWYHLTDKLKAFGYAFECDLVFATSGDNGMHGFRGYLDIEDDAQRAATIAMDLAKKLTGSYGAPVTDAKRDDRIIGQRELADAIRASGSIWREEWRIEDPKTMDVGLVVANAGESRWRIVVEYRVPGSEVPQGYFDLIGKSIEEVQAIQTDLQPEEPEVGIYRLVDQQTMYGYAFDVRFMFDIIGEHGLYAIDYDLQVEDDIDLAASTAEILVAKLSETYGEPGTYPGRISRILGNESLADEIRKPNHSWMEEWRIEEPAPLDIILQVSHMDEPRWGIKIVFRTQDPRIEYL